MAKKRQSRQVRGALYDLAARVQEIEYRLGGWSESVERRVTNVVESCGFLPERMARIENRLNALDAIFSRLAALEKTVAETAGRPTITIQHAEVKV
jgi:ParB-like chromosome segregation protein Spo0J